MSLSVRQVAGRAGSVVERLWPIYVHYLSEFRGTLPDATGSLVFKRERLTSYVEDTRGDRVGYLAWQGDHPVGLALVRGWLDGPRMIGHFLVVRGVRRTGLGRDLGLDVIGRHERPWEVAFQEDNAGAARFWRGIADTAFGDDWHEERRPVPDQPELPPDVWIVAS
ncbi:MAG: GNAT family N-acetyltransferase [Marmoricola sp.]